MSEKSFKDRIKSDRDREKQDIDDWMSGSGTKVFGIMTVAIGVWLIINLIW